MAEMLYQQRVVGKTTMHYEYDVDEQATQDAANWRQFTIVGAGWWRFAARQVKESHPDGEVWQTLEAIADVIERDALADALEEEAQS